MAAKLSQSNETTKFILAENKNNSLITNELQTKSLPVPYGASRLNVPVCICNGIAPKIVEKTTLDGFFTKIKALGSDPLSINSIKASANVKALFLSYKETGDKKPYDEQKQRLQGVVFGDYKTRKDSDCLTYTGLMGLDIDGYTDTVDMSFDLSELKKNHYVFAAFPSPSNHGLRILVWTDSTFETHKATYKSLLSFMSNSLNISTDKEQKPHLDETTVNPSRLWFFTHTTDIYLNTDSQVFTPSVFTATDTPTANVATEKPAKSDIKKPHNNKQTLTDAEKITACTEMSNRRNNSDWRNNFVFNTACLCVEHGVNSDTILSHFVSTYVADDFKESEIKKTVNSAIKKAKFGIYTDAQLLAYLNNKTPSVSQATTKATPSVPTAKKATPSVPTTDDGTFEADKKGAMNETEEYISERYDLRYNYILNEFEISRLGKNRFTILNQNDLLRELQSQKIRASDKSLKVTLLSSFVPRYNPIKAEFLSLKDKWKEGDKDHIAQFTSHVETTDQYFFNLHFKKMLVRVVACALGHIPFNKHCFTLYSTQNDGKTSLFRALCPESLKPYYKENLDVDKDGRLALCQNLFINLDELRGLSKADINEIKTYFSMETVKDRIPYGDKPEIFKRTASFFASTNNRDFLTDETGNVRWLVFEVKKINHDRGGKNGYMSVDIPAMWSQAVHLLYSGFEYQLTQDEIAYSEINNKVNYSKTTYEMELIQEMFDVGTEQEHDFKYTAAKISEEITIGTNRKISYNQIGKAMTSLGFTTKRDWDKIKKNTGTFYFLKKRVD